jgi:hypothetical protein
MGLSNVQTVCDMQLHGSLVAENDLVTNYLPQAIWPPESIQRTARPHLLMITESGEDVTHRAWYPPFLPVFPKTSPVSLSS